MTGLKTFMLNQEREMSGANDCMECSGCGEEKVENCTCHENSNNVLSQIKEIVEILPKSEQIEVRDFLCELYNK